MKKYAIIVAAGSGSRMKSSLPKQFLSIGNKPLLYYSINTFTKAFPGINIILVLPEQFMANGQEIIDGFFDPLQIKVTAGGLTRFDSVKNGLALVDEESIVFVHDGVRCLVSEALIHRCYEAAILMGTAIPALPVKDSIRIMDGDESSPVDRELVRIVQTPQTFHSKIIIAAYQIDYKDKFTDEATVAEAYGLKVHLVEGEEENIKVTMPADLLIAEKILKEREEF